MNTATQKRLVFPLLLFSLSIVLLLAACGGSSSPTVKKATPTPTPTPAETPANPQGQALLQKVGKELTSARSLHGLFNLQITGQLFNGTLNSEIWNVSPNKNRTHILNSTISQFPTDMVTVTNGKQVWQYDPTKKVVYTGPQPQNTSSTSSAATQVGGQSQLVLGIIQTVFARSKATTLTDNLPLLGATTTDIHVVSQSSSTASGGTATPGGNGGSFQYTGDVYINKATQKPIRIDLGINSVGQVVLDLP
ncbi:MAG TPA: hypothetical protein VFN23_04275, partial [Ktedonobacteraceae bacterium]|nr:hypothetical protein [Ktedonobacteraceae bacterium]